MLKRQKGKNRIFIQIIAIVTAQVFFVTSLGYTCPHYNALRVPMDQSGQRVAQVLKHAERDEEKDQSAFQSYRDAALAAFWEQAVKSGVDVREEEYAVRNPAMISQIIINGKPYRYVVDGARYLLIHRDKDMVTKAIDFSLPRVRELADQAIDIFMKDFLSQDDIGDNAYNLKQALRNYYNQRGIFELFNFMQGLIKTPDMTSNNIELISIAADVALNIMHKDSPLGDTLPRLMEQARILQEYREPSLTRERILLALARAKVLKIDIAPLLAPVLPEYKDIEDLRKDFLNGKIDIDTLSGNLGLSAYNPGLSGNGEIDNLYAALIWLSEYPDAEKLGMDIRELFKETDLKLIRDLNIAELLENTKSLLEKTGQIGIELLALLDALSDNPRIAEGQYLGWLSSMRSDTAISASWRKQREKALNGLILKENITLEDGEYEAELAVLNLTAHTPKQIIEYIDAKAEDSAEKKNLMFSKGIIVHGRMGADTLNLLRSFERQYGEKPIYCDINGRLVPVEINQKPKPKSRIWNSFLESKGPRKLLYGATVLLLIPILIWQLSGASFEPQSALFVDNPPWREDKESGQTAMDPGHVLMLGYEPGGFSVDLKSYTPFPLSGKLELGYEGHPEWNMGGEIYLEVPDEAGGYNFTAEFVPNDGRLISLDNQGFNIFKKHEYRFSGNGIWRIPIPAHAEGYNLIIKAKSIYQVKDDMKSPREQRITLGLWVVGPLTYELPEGQDRVVYGLKPDAASSSRNIDAKGEFDRLVRQVNEPEIVKKTDGKTEPGVKKDSKAEYKMPQIDSDKLLFIADASKYEAGESLFNSKIAEFTKGPIPRPDQMTAEAFQDAMSKRIADFVALIKMAQELDSEAGKLESEANVLSKAISKQKQSEVQVALTSEEITKMLKDIKLRKDHLKDIPLLVTVIGSYDKLDRGALSLLLNLLGGEIRDLKGLEALEREIGMLKDSLGNAGRVVEADSLNKGLTPKASKIVEEAVKKFDEPDPIPGGAMQQVRFNPIPLSDSMLTSPPFIGLENAKTPEEFLHSAGYYFGWTKTALEKLNRTVFNFKSNAVGRGGGLGSKDKIEVDGFEYEALFHEAKHDFWFNLRDNDRYCREIYGVSFKELRMDIYRAMLETARHYRSAEFPEGDPDYKYPEAAKRSYFSLYGKKYGVGSFIGSRDIINPLDSVEENLKRIMDNESIIDVAHAFPSFWPLDIQEDKLPPELWRFFKPIYTGSPRIREWALSLTPVQLAEYRKNGTYLEREAIRWFVDWKDTTPDAPALREATAVIKSDKASIDNATVKVEEVKKETEKAVQLSTEDRLFIRMVKIRGARWLDSYVRQISPDERSLLGPKLEALGRDADIAKIWMSTDGTAIRLLMHKSIPEEIKTLIQHQVPPMKLLVELGFIPARDYLDKNPNTLPDDPARIWDWLDKAASGGINTQYWVDNIDNLNIQSYPDTMKYDQKLHDVVYETLAWLIKYYPNQGLSILQNTEIKLSDLYIHPEVLVTIAELDPEFFMSQVLSPRAYMVFPSYIFNPILEVDKGHDIAVKIFIDMYNFKPAEKTDYTVTGAREIIIAGIFRSSFAKEGALSLHAEFLYELVRQKGSAWLEGLMSSNSMLEYIYTFNAEFYNNPTNIEITAAKIVNALNNKSERDELAKVMNVALRSWGRPELVKKDNGLWQSLNSETKPVMRQQIFQSIPVGTSNFTFEYRKYDETGTVELIEIPRDSGDRFYQQKQDGSGLWELKGFSESSNHSSSIWGDKFSKSYRIIDRDQNGRDVVLEKFNAATQLWDTVANLITGPDVKVIYWVFRGDGKELAVGVAPVNSKGEISQNIGQIRVYDLSQFADQLEIPAGAYKYKEDKFFQLGYPDSKAGDFSGNWRLSDNGAIFGKTQALFKADKDAAGVSIIDDAEETGIDNFAVSDDGDLVAIAYNDGTIKIKSLSSGWSKTINSGAEVPVRVVSAIAFSPKEDTIAISYKDGFLIVYDHFMDKYLAPLLLKEAIYEIDNIRFSEEGNILIGSDKNGNIFVVKKRSDGKWSWENLRIVRLGNASEVSELAVSPSGYILAAFGAGNIGDDVFVIEDGEKIRTERILGNMGMVKGAVFISDNELLIEAGLFGRSTLWRFFRDSKSPEWQKEQIMNFEYPSYETIFQKDGKGFARLVEKPVERVTGNVPGFERYSLSQENPEAVSINTTSYKYLGAIADGDKEINAVAYSQDGRWMLAVGDQGIYAYKGESNTDRFIVDETLTAYNKNKSDNLLRMAVSDGYIKADITHAAINKDGSLMAFADWLGNLVIYRDVKSAKELGLSRNYDGINANSYNITSLKFSRDTRGDILAIGYANGDVLFYRFNPLPEIFVPVEHFVSMDIKNPAVVSIEFSTDGTKMAVSRKDNTIFIYTKDENGIWGRKGQMVVKGGQVNSFIAFSPDSMKFTGNSIEGGYIDIHGGGSYPNKIYSGVPRGAMFISDTELLIEGRDINDKGLLGGSYLWKFTYNIERGNWEKKEIMSFDKPSIRTIFSNGGRDFVRIIEVPSQEGGTMQAMEIYSLENFIQPAQLPKTSSSSKRVPGLARYMPKPTMSDVQDSLIEYDKVLSKARKDAITMQRFANQHSKGIYGPEPLNIVEDMADGVKDLLNKAESIRENIIPPLLREVLYRALETLYPDNEKMQEMRGGIEALSSQDKAYIMFLATLSPARRAELLQRFAVSHGFDVTEFGSWSRQNRARLLKSFDTLGLRSNASLVDILTAIWDAVSNDYSPIGNEVNSANSSRSSL